MFKKLKLLFCKKKEVPLILRFRQDLTDPAKNTREIIEIVARNGQKIHNKSDRDYMFIGRFFSVTLLVEHALGNIIEKVAPEKMNSTLGGKISFLKKIIDALENQSEDDEDEEELRKLIEPMRELQGIRDQFAHNIEKVEITEKEIGKILRYIRDNFESKYNELAPVKFPESRDKIECFLALFAWCMIERLTWLEQILESPETRESSNKALSKP